VAQTFLLTGCAGGIGRQVAQVLVSRGERVIATDIDEQALARAAEDWRSDQLVLARLDVTDDEGWQRLVRDAVDRWGRLDVLYNIAGFLMPGWVHEIALRDIDRHLDINVKGVMLGTRIAAEQMVLQGAGHIVNVASMAAYAPIPGLSLYSASKYAVRAFSLAAATELADRGVAVTVLCPDAVATPMLDKQKAYDEASMTFTAPRILTAEEVAAVLTGSILRDRPLEVAIPRRRKWLARAADLVPEAGRWMKPLMERTGRAKRRRAQRGG
jgi:3-oxoacyl-[acyl-carrier protein] reductase